MQIHIVLIHASHFFQSWMIVKHVWAMRLLSAGTTHNGFTASIGLQPQNVEVECATRHPARLVTVFVQVAVWVGACAGAQAQPQKRQDTIVSHQILCV